MSEPASFRDVIELWPSREALAADIGAGAPAVSKWWQRDSIPADWWASILTSERASKAGISSAMMTIWASRAPVELPDLLEARSA